MECIICKKIISQSSEGAVLYEKGAASINAASLQRCDSITAVAGESVHTACRKEYTKQRNIDASKKQQSHQTEKRVLRSEATQFDFKIHCLFCGEGDKGDRKRKNFELTPVRTFEFQKTVEQICRDRNDVWAIKVNDRVKTAIDLHAADAVYHKQCSVNFRTGKGPFPFHSQFTNRMRSLFEIRMRTFAMRF